MTRPHDGDARSHGRDQEELGLRAEGKPFWLARPPERRLVNAIGGVQEGCPYEEHIAARIDAAPGGPYADAVRGYRGERPCPSAARIVRRRVHVHPRRNGGGPAGRGRRRAPRVLDARCAPGDRSALARIERSGSVALRCKPVRRIASVWAGEREGRTHSVDQPRRTFVARALVVLVPAVALLLGLAGVASEQRVPRPQDVVDERLHDGA